MIFYDSPLGRIHHGDSLVVLPTLEAESVDGILTDPPYGLGFMGKEWDIFKAGDIAMRRNPQMDAVNTGASKQGGRQRACADYQKRQARDMRAFQEWCEAWAVEAFRVAKPGAYLLAFGGTRTFHRLACAIEDAGWELRDTIMWVYGSGFPKSLDVSKAIDKAAGTEREVVGKGPKLKSMAGHEPSAGRRYTENGGTSFAALPGARRLDSGSAARFFQACEFAPEELEGQRFLYCGKAPTKERSVYLTCDCETVKLSAWVKEDRSQPGQTAATSPPKATCEGTSPDASDSSTSSCGSEPTVESPPDSASITSTGTRPTTGLKTSALWGPQNTSDSTADVKSETECGSNPADCAEAFTPSTSNIGISPRKVGPCTGVAVPATSPLSSETRRCVVCGATVRKSNHPTVKPPALMKYLAKLIRPPTERPVLLDPFMGSGTTLCAGAETGWFTYGVDLEESHGEIAVNRLEGLF